jgi:hypothetical protein
LQEFGANPAELARAAIDCADAKSIKRPKKREEVK